MTRTALVTGAAGGIGKSICEVFAQAGYKVVGTDRKEVTGLPYHVLKYDITDYGTNPEETDRLHQYMDTELDGRLDVLVNNAAVQIVKPIAQIKNEDWCFTMETNLIAPFRLVQGFLPNLTASKGCVINISSIHAMSTKSEFCLYATSKGALNTMTRSLAIELAPEVRVVSINPAATDTQMLRAGFEGNLAGFGTLGEYHPVGRIARPEEIAEIVLFLSSSKAGFITGASINVDGGIGACLHDPVT